MLTAHRTNDGECDVVYTTIEDAVATLRTASSFEGSAFHWPYKEFGFFKATCVSMHMAPPNTMTIIKNGKRIPKDLLKCHPTWEPVLDDMEAKGETVSDESDIIEVYHGCSFATSLLIAANGFKPTIGAGCEALEEHFGVPLGGVFFAGSWKVASNYPMTSTTGVIPHWNYAVNGGTLVDTCGAYPKRVVIRCLARKSCYLWHKQQNNGEMQYIFRPQDVHPTHFCYYSVGPTLCHRMQTMQNVYQISFTLEKEKYSLLYDYSIFSEIS